MRCIFVFLSNLLQLPKHDVGKTWKIKLELELSVALIPFEFEQRVKFASLL